MVTEIPGCPMDDASLGTAYFDWLYSLACPAGAGGPGEAYSTLCYQLHKEDFAVLVPMDENRADDAVQLRDDFHSRDSFFHWEDWEELMTMTPSVFEVMVALAKRAEFMTGRTLAWWFGEFLANLKLNGFCDSEFELGDEARISRVIRKFNQRRYDSHGRGGLFPLREPEEDQRTVQLWYQLSAYAGENHMY